MSGRRCHVPTGIPSTGTSADIGWRPANQPGYTVKEKKTGRSRARCLWQRLSDDELSTGRIGEGRI
jgi:hypothetical protein